MKGKCVICNETQIASFRNHVLHQKTAKGSDDLSQCQDRDTFESLILTRYFIPLQLSTIAKPASIVSLNLRNRPWLYNMFF